MIYFIVLYIILGLISTYLVTKKPSRYLTIFLISIIIGSGPMVMGYPVVDEYMVLMLFLGIILRANIVTNNGAIKVTKENHLNFHNLVFYVLIWYLLFQSFRGMIWLEDLRMIRWIIFFVIVGYGSFLISNYRYPIDRRQVVKVIFYSSSIYFFIYLIVGFLFEIFFDGDRYDLQGFIWTGTSGAHFPIPLYLISVLVFFNEFKNKKAVRHIFLSLAVVSTCSVYYSSRAALFFILVAIIYYSLILFRERFALFLKLLLFGFIIVMLDSSTNQIIKNYLPFDFDTKNITIPDAINLDTRDYGRVLHNVAAYEAINDSVATLFLGHGWYMARYEMKKSIIKVRSREGLDISHISSDTSYQPSGAAAMLVDTGIIGVLLYPVSYTHLTLPTNREV
mgnify:FL=1